MAVSEDEANNRGLAQMAKRQGKSTRHAKQIEPASNKRGKGDNKIITYPRRTGADTYDGHP